MLGRSPWEGALIRALCLYNHIGTQQAAQAISVNSRQMLHTLLTASLCRMQGVKQPAFSIWQNSFVLFICCACTCVCQRVPGITLLREDEIAVEANQLDQIGGAHLDEQLTKLEGPIFIRLCPIITESCLPSFLSPHLRDVTVER